MNRAILALICAFYLVVAQASVTLDPFVGTSRVFDGTMDGKIEVRSNGGAAMLDQLIAPAPAVGTVIIVKNNDATALEEVRAQPTVALDGRLGGFRVLGPGQSGEFVSDGTGYLTHHMPDRTRLPDNASVSFYVDADHGSDANSGITAAASFLTMQGALDDFFIRYDMAGGYYVLQAVSTTTHYQPVSIRGSMSGHYGYPGLAGVSFEIRGNPADPSQVVIDGALGPVPGNAVEVLVGKSLHLDGVTLQSTAGAGVYATLPGTEVPLHNVNFGPCADAQVHANNLATVLIEGNWKAVGDAPYFIYADKNATVENIGAGNTVTFSGTRSYSGFVVGSARNSTVNIYGVTWVGASVSGQRWKTLLNGVIEAGHANLDAVIPGSIAGGNNYGGQTWWP